MSHFSQIEKALDNREREQRAKMRKVVQKIHAVKELAGNIGDELDLQEETIEDLGVAVDNAKNTVVGVTERLKRLIESSGIKWHACAVIILGVVFFVVCVVTVLIGQI